MTRYTLMLFQSAYPEQIRIDKGKGKDGIYIECWLLNEDKEPHMLLFDGGPFQSEAKIDETIQSLLEVKIENED